MNRALDWRLVSAMPVPTSGCGDSWLGRIMLSRSAESSWEGRKIAQGDVAA
ncbi:hypothetical protein [Microcoleus sp. FACHB-672]|uniref:hypothetical protein n=1 Tax=Microcoleus sp. FACHB-672 TaxID=2692825 RepID=UPI001688992C|nr:hypothetical protein [Microcoleus sp. FACHB-672]MBD2043749.1 hypothetical protein [Microcoleus sp. FACHB-672]